MSSATRSSKSHAARGQALITSVLFLLLIGAFGLLLTNVVISNLKRVEYVQQKDQDGWLAEAGLQKAVWCVNQDATQNSKCGGAAGSSYAGETVSLGGGSVVISASGTGATKTLTAVATYLGIRRSKTIVVSGTGTASFPFAIGSTGTGAMNIASTAVSGPVYTNGDLTCSTSNLIPGEVVLSGNHTMTNCHMSGNATAHAIKGSTIGGDAYYTTIQTSTVAGALHPASPDSATFTAPISNALIAQWKNDAKGGGTTAGDVTVSGNNASLGPKEITGNLTLSNNGTLTIAGTVYVHGNITFSNNSTALAAGYGSNDGVLIADGTVTISNNGTVSGSGSAGSYLLVISLSSSSSAVSVSNNGNAPILYAPNGGVVLSNNSSADAVSSSTFTGSNNTSITYATDMQNLHVIADPGAPPSVWSIVTGTRAE